MESRNCQTTGSGVTATPGAPAPPEGPRVLGTPARSKEKINDAVQAVVGSVDFFDTLQEIFVFFGSSLNR